MNTEDRLFFACRCSCTCAVYNNSVAKILDQTGIYRSHIDGNSLEVRDEDTVEDASGLQQL